MPEKKQAKRSTPKKKSTARENAEQRMQRQGTAGAVVRAPRSVKEISQQRFPGETPLTGEDRPVTRSRGKQHGYRGPKLGTGNFEGIAAKKFVGAPPKKRRPTSRDRNR